MLGASLNKQFFSLRMRVAVNVFLSNFLLLTATLMLTECDHLRKILR